MAKTDSHESAVNRARRLELGSTIADWLPPLNKYVHGRQATNPHLEYRRWIYVPSLLASEIEWSVFECYPAPQSKLPKNWDNAALLGASRVDLARLTAKSNVVGQPAYFYRLDPEADVVMGAVLPYHQGSKFNGDYVNHRHADYLAIASRIGEGALMATVGLIDLTTRNAAVLEGSQIYTENISTQAINLDLAYANVAII